jgi:hypothetical protein
MSPMASRLDRAIGRTNARAVTRASGAATARLPQFPAPREAACRSRPTARMAPDCAPPRGAFGIAEPNCANRRMGDGARKTRHRARARSVSSGAATLATSLIHSLSHTPQPNSFHRSPSRDPQTLTIRPAHPLEPSPPGDLRAKAVRQTRMPSSGARPSVAAHRGPPSAQLVLRKPIDDGPSRAFSRQLSCL